MVGLTGMGMGMRGKKVTMKRKDSDLDMDGLHQDFSDFSLSSPARKIRRLDVELPPIMEEEDESQEISCSAAPASVKAPESESESVNDKAIVLFKPLKSPFFCSLPAGISVDSDMISGFKDQFIRATTQRKRTTIEEDKAVSSSHKDCLAVVPWAPPSQLIAPPTASGVEISQPPTEQPDLTMEAEDSMEIEDTSENLLQLGQSGDGYSGVAGMRMVSEGLPQWQQQHCTVPQPPHYTSTPITWFL